MALRDVFRASRYAGDLIGEIRLGHPRLAEGEATASAFAGNTAFLEINPAYGPGPLRLEPGDVVLQRGMAHNSAAIARIGDVDSQFSHVSMVAYDGTGTSVMVEALIEDGSLITPVDKALAHGLGRAILFRHRDRALALEASELIRDHVLKFDGRSGPRILYDFTMEPEGYGELFCAKLVRLAYSMASDGRHRLPAYPTLLDMKNRDFISRIGVTASETFAPGDLELETGFDIVAEWRDYRVTSELRLKDMIMFKLFEWMEAHGYKFRASPGIRLIACLGRLSSHLPASVQERLRSLAGKVPPNMGSSAIGAVAMLHKTAEELYARLHRLESDSIATSGHQLHPRQVMHALEEMRAGLGDRIGYLVRS
jgi:hypothetical protein